MKNNMLVTELLMKVDQKKKVYFQGEDTKALSLGNNFYEVFNTLVIFVSEDKDETASVESLLNIIGDNYYTGAEGEDGTDLYFSVALSTLEDWGCRDTIGFSSLREITGVLELEDSIILTTVDYNSNSSYEKTINLNILGTDEEVHKDFISSINMLAESDEYKKHIHIFS